MASNTNSKQNNASNSGDKRHEDNLDPKKRSEIGQMGGEKRKELADEGKAMSYEEMGSLAHEKGAHEFTSEEARKAGEIGGRNSHGGGRQSDDE
jgi:general stress protein YciG